jgi:hypothetical protein
MIIMQSNYVKREALDDTEKRGSNDRQKSCFLKISSKFHVGCSGANNSFTLQSIEHRWRTLLKMLLKWSYSAIS